MGDLKGHALPGSIFLGFGFWWLFCGIRRYLLCKKSGRAYKSTVTFECMCRGRCGNFPFEPVLKVVMPFCGILVEVLAHLPVLPTRIVQHATMYSLFLLSGVLDLALHYGVVLPPGADYLCLAMCLAVEGLLFANHLHDRPILDIHIHTLLVYVIFASVAVIILEAKVRDSPILTVARGYLTMLQGSWFWAVGIILYGHGGEHLNTAWKMDSHEEAMLTTIYFSWHCAVHFIIFFIISLSLACYYKMMPCSKKVGTSSLPDKHLGNGVSQSQNVESYSMLPTEDVVEAEGLLSDEEL